MWALVLAAALGSVTGASAQGPAFGHVRHMLPPSAADTLAVAVADVDGDGDLDSLHVGLPPDRLLLNDGTGWFGEDTSFRLPPSRDVSLSVAFADVDGDGDIDAFVGKRQQDALYLNDGSGFFSDTSSTNLPASQDTTFAISFGDVDGDGDLDVLLGGSLGVRLYSNDGAGSFADVSATHLPESDGADALVLGDVDGDGDLDAVIGYGTLLSLYLNSGGGVFSNVTATHWPQASSYPTSIALADVDGDDDLDALVGSDTSLRATPAQLYLNDGTGVFSDVSATALPPDSGTTLAIAAGDVDGDGDIDVVLGKGGARYGAPDRLLINNGAGVFSDSTGTHLPAIAMETRGLALADVTSDGDLDLLFANKGQDELYLNDGTGRFSDATDGSAPRHNLSTRTIALGDVDGDGDPDALIASSPPRLYVNDGNGSYLDVTRTRLPPSSDVSEDVALGDVDGDGDLDALIGHGYHLSARQSRLYLNDGSGVFSDVTATHLPKRSDVTGGVALGDVDGDGDLDALLANSTEQHALYINDGSGVFRDASATRLPSITVNGWAAALGDIDGDGDLDALIAGAGKALLLNDGNGVFSDATSTHLVVSTNWVMDIALGDLDGDGDVDACFAALNAQSRVLENDGSGVFSDVTATHLTLRTPNAWAVALGDVDGDGDLDAAFGMAGNTAAGEQNEVHLNDGAGVLRHEPTAFASPPRDETEALALEDVDRDGDLDMWIGNNGRNRLAFNLKQQLAWRAVPRVGQRLVLDLFGTPGKPWSLVASIDGVTWLPAGTGVLDGTGRAAVDFAVPGQRSLVGARVFWLAGIGLPPVLTNLEPTTFTGL